MNVSWQYQRLHSLTYSSLALQRVEYGLSSADSVMANRIWPAFPSCRRPQSSTARSVVQVQYQGVAYFTVPLCHHRSTWSSFSFRTTSDGSSGTNSRVVIINLSSKSLKGPIPPEISHLTYLQELYLDNNNIEDPIPPEIGQLKYLEKLSINSNDLTSSPPEALLNCKLTSLSLHENRISGELPAWIGQLSTLKILDMHSNDFWGGLPPEYGKLKNLENLQLWGNELSGLIPDEWRDLTNVHSL